MRLMWKRLRKIIKYVNERSFRIMDDINFEKKPFCYLPIIVIIESHALQIKIKYDVFLVLYGDYMMFFLILNS